MPTLPPTPTELLRAAQLYVLIDGGSSATDFGSRASQLVAAGVHVLQLRDKTLDDRTQLARARQLRALTAGTQTLFIVNDRPDLAMLSGADGVHVGQDEIAVEDVRRLVGEDRFVGVSTHTTEQVRDAVAANATYIGCGPTYPSGTKRFSSFPGTAFLRDVAREITLPAFAIGGISLDNLSEVLSTGFSRIAVSGAVTRADDPAAVVQQLLAQLRRVSAEEVRKE